MTNFDGNLAAMHGIDPHLKPFTKGLPTRDNCDLTDPYEMFLWPFVALPGVRGGQLILPIDYYQLVSKRLYDVGAMLTCDNCGHTREPALAYRHPSADDPNWATSAGQWLPTAPAEQPAQPPDPGMGTQQLQDALDRSRALREQLGVPPSDLGSGDNT